ncbi:hypothetical protein KIN20_008760 [Parelaphostrongylus tenuis]|uniref:Uncharacterized protein n=1 Tax=Parelaphostrongylus tenuis TaxID=148309 RepID=A0AAD5M787_PARTN|nr:hypothetical protein KIN20_008760 [Parelaphostrongylus tenuis]
MEIWLSELWVNMIFPGIEEGDPLKRSSPRSFQKPTAATSIEKSINQSHKVQLSDWTKKGQRRTQALLRDDSITGDGLITQI